MMRKYNLTFFFIITLLIIFSAGINVAQQDQEPPSQGSPATEYKAEGLRDPFLRQEDYAPEPGQEGQAGGVLSQPEPQKPLPDLALQGIIWEGKLPQAIINHKVVKIGDTIEGARITDINKNGVSVSFDNRQYDLSLTQPKEGRNER